jgi:ABC-2 type transport system permease protein
MIALFDKFLAIARRDFLVSLRYHRAFLLLAISAFVQLAGFYYMARAIGPGFRPDGIPYYPFLLVGTAVLGFFVAGVNSFPAAVAHAQISGTFEALLTTATRPAVIILLSGLSDFAGRTLHMALFLAGGLGIFGVAIHDPNIPACGLVYLLLLLIGVAVGMMAAAVQIVVQKGSAVVWMVSTGISLLSGVVFPVSALPGPLQSLARLIPLTYALDAIRLALIRSSSLIELRGPILILAAYALLLLPFSFVLFDLALRRARREGTVSAY